MITIKLSINIYCYSSVEPKQENPPNEIIILSEGAKPNTVDTAPVAEAESEQTYSQIMMELNSAKSQLTQLYDLVS